MGSILFSCATPSSPIVCPDISSHLNLAELQCLSLQPRNSAMPCLGYPSVVRKVPPGIKLGNLRFTSLVSLFQKSQSCDACFPISKTIASHILFCFLDFYCGKGSLNPVTPSWPEADFVLDMFLFVFKAKKY